jgi:hypothetical protein
VTSLNILYDEIRKLPGAPLRHPLSDANALRHRLCIYVVGSLGAATEMGMAAQHVWFAGQFLAASALIRMLIELWGSIGHQTPASTAKLPARDREAPAIIWGVLPIRTRVGAG